MVRCLSPAIVYSLLVGVAGAQSDELKIEAVADFKTFYRQNKDVAQRVEAVMTLKGNECIPAATELLKLLEAKEEKVRIAAMNVISTFKQAVTFQP